MTAIPDDQDVYYDFSGFIVLNNDTMLEYIGEDESQPQLITVKEWKRIDDADLRAEYILEDFIAAYRDANDIDFDGSRISQL